MASRQREWQKKQQAAGNCMICGKPRTKGKIFCEEHRKQKNARQNAKKVVDRQKKDVIG